MRRVSLFILPGLVFCVSGCSTMQGIANVAEAGKEISVDVQDNGRLAYKGKLRRIDTIGGQTTLTFKDGTVYTVADSEYNVTPGDVIRIYQTPKGLWARRFQLDQGDKVADGKITRLAFGSDTTMVYLDNGQAYEVDGTVRSRPGDAVAIYKDDFGYRAQ